jgi:hypothetical protein
LKKKAKTLIDELGICLVYPIANKAEPPSLWHALWPRAEMDWSWDNDADDRVVDLWHLRARLAESHQVAYGKWFKGRATFFSLPVFHALLGRICETGDPFADLPRAAHDILALLRERSPLSTKLLRQEAGLRGKQHDRAFNQAMKILWSRLLIVGVGEVEDGAFPSLAVGATELVFEDLWLSRADVSADSRKRLAAALSRSKAFEKEHDRIMGDLRRTAVRMKSPAKRIYSYDDL